MGLIGKVFKKDSRNLTKQVKGLAKTLVDSLEDADELDSAEAYVELELVGDYVTDADGNTHSMAGIKIETPDMVEALGLTGEAGIDQDSIVLSDATRGYKLKFGIKGSRTFRGSEE